MGPFVAFAKRSTVIGGAAALLVFIAAARNADAQERPFSKYQVDRTGFFLRFGLGLEAMRDTATVETFGPNDIAIPHGIAVAAVPVPVGPDGRPLAGEVSHPVLISEDVHVLDVRPGPDEDEYVFIGVHPGETWVHVTIEDVEVDVLKASVTEQGR